MRNPDSGRLYIYIYIELWLLNRTETTHSICDQPARVATANFCTRTIQVKNTERKNTYIIYTHKTLRGSFQKYNIVNSF